MRRRTYRQWLFISQILVVAGLGLAAIWNVAGLVLGGPEPVWWMLPLLPLPGLISWLIAVAVPKLMPRLSAGRQRRSFRLTYDTPPAWDDGRLRQALLNMIRLGSAVDIIWARDGQEVGCWLLLADDGQVLGRLIADLLPGGVLEADPHPPVGAGVVLLRGSQKNPLPPPQQLCQLDGVDGVYFRWRCKNTATVALWGADAAKVARQWAKRGDLLPEQGSRLLYPFFIGDNPWPQLPPLPPSTFSPGLSSVSRLEQLAPALRLNGHSGLILGRDREQQSIGFALPDLVKLQDPLRIYGQNSAQVAASLARQVLQAKMPVMMLDGEGSLVAGLGRHLLREVSTGQVLICDVQRPAQSRFRLNPLWLPDEQAAWPLVFAGGWFAWLRELGVTPGGLGREAYRHTQVAVALTAVLAARRGLTLDVPALTEALEMPDFLATLGDGLDGAALLEEDIWQWWQDHGRGTPNFDVHLRLAHVRERLNALLALPEYRVLWRAPYLDLLTAIQDGTSLLWRLPDPRRRLRGYLTSQLLALTTLLAVWPSTRPPLLVILHEVNVEPWVKRLLLFPGARLILSSAQTGGRPTTDALLLSRLDREDAQRVQGELPGVRASDLRRLPDRRLLLRRGADICTMDMTE